MYLYIYIYVYLCVCVCVCAHMLVCLGLWHIKLCIAKSAGAVEYTDLPLTSVLDMLELWGMRSTPSLPSLPGGLWPIVVAPDRALSMG